MFEQPEFANFQSGKNLNLDACQETNILIIDDNRSNLEYLFEVLTNLGYNILMENSGQAGIERAESAQPDLILLDVVMPNMDGFETCSRLKQNLLTQNIPVIFMTALSEIENRVKGFEMGAVDYITKPIQEAEILARIRTHLTIQSLQNKLREQNIRLQYQMARSRLLAEMQERIRQSLDLKDILNTTVKEVREFLQTDRVIIYKFQSNVNGVVMVESVGSQWQKIKQQKIVDPCLKEKCFQIYKEGQSKAIKDIYTEGLKECYIDFLAQFQVKANLIVPIRKRENLWGLLIAHHCSKPREWQQLEIESIEQLVTQVGIAIQQAQLYQKLKVANQRLHRLASIDTLTQLANRRHFNTYLREEWRRSTQEQSEEKELPLSLILCDVDFFKLYNDTYGHLAGDFCLQQIAKAIQSAVFGTNSLVARYGGEELAVILPDTKIEDAVYIAERIRTRIKGLKISHVKSPIGKYVTLSLGISTIVPSGENNPAELIAVADRALYRAKEQGRDRLYFIRRNDPDDMGTQY